MKLSEKVGIAAGAAAGVGAASAEFFARPAAAMAVTDIDADGVQRTATTIQQRGGKIDDGFSI